jgi:rod shape determining protein RodA
MAIDNRSWFQKLFPAYKIGYAERTIFQRMHLDLPLLIGLLLIIIVGLTVLFSASNKNPDVVYAQLSRFALAGITMFLVAQINPVRFQQWSPWLYIAGIVLLIVVLLAGHTGKGAQRWLNLGLFRFQPSEIMKIATPMMVAHYLAHKKNPPNLRNVIIAGLIILFPMAIVMKQPDLGTAIMIALSGSAVILFAGIRWRWVLSTIIAIIACTPVLWHFMHQYQKNRVLTFLNPERDPLGAGYHIIQSKIAIGSGGIFGKGWFHGTQAHLDFLPEHSTDFIYSVLGEEFGLFGGVILLLLYVYIFLRCVHIANHATDQYARLLAGSIGFTFFVSVFVNIGMVTGILPVVGLPLPLLSYGGTSVVTLLASFGILMSISTHRRLVAT